MRWLGIVETALLPESPGLEETVLLLLHIHSLEAGAPQ